MKHTVDIAVIGAGIAGASVAARLAQAGKKVAVLEMEQQPGYHTTGRSAAVFAPSYGPAPIRALTRASAEFFGQPPKGFSDAPLLAPRAALMIARSDQQDALNAMAETLSGGGVKILEGAAVRDQNPLLRKGYAQNAIFDPVSQDIDVAALHQGFLRLLKSAGGVVLTRSEVIGMTATSKGWQMDTRKGEVTAQIVVNAAGAWADQLGHMAGAVPIGLIPKRRTAGIIAAPATGALHHLPITIDIEEQFYLKPDAGRLLISPADETPSSPCDAQPEDIDIAICVDRIERAFDLQVSRIETKWAGLRSFVTDKSPVAGFDAQAQGFYWLAGQGGYGIQTAPALSEFAASQILGKAVPAHIADEGVLAGLLAPARF